jgi:hypothetical protein
MRRLPLLFAAVLALALAGPVAAQTCPPGTSSPTGSAPCTVCGAGYFAPSLGMTACLPCPQGSFSLPGSAICSVCPAGTFAPFPGSAFCTPCPDGFISTTGSAQCTPCPPGYTSDPSHTFCVENPTPAAPTTWGRLKIIYR